MTWWHTFVFLPFCLIIYLVGGCSSTSRKQEVHQSAVLPPEVANWPINETLLEDKDKKSVDLFLSRIEKENGEASTQWWATYRRAQLWNPHKPKKSCQAYRSLATAPGFPLAAVAALRQIEICSPKVITEDDLSVLNFAKLDPWLHPLARDIEILWLRRTRQWKPLMNKLWEKSKLPLAKAEKVELTQQALTLAKSHGDTSEQRALQRRLYRLSPSQDPKPALRDYLSVAHDYRHRRHFESARSYYEKIVKNSRASTNLKIKALKGIRSSYRLQHRKDLALKASSRLSKYSNDVFKKSPKTLEDHTQNYQIQLIYARDLWTANQKTKAQNVLSLLEKTSESILPITDVYWIRGRMAAESQKYPEAVEYFDKALATKEVNEAWNERLVWHKAWTLRKMTQWEEATKLLDDLVDRTENPFEKSKYLFWLAQTYRDHGNESDYVDALEKVTKEVPHHYYSYLAHRELQSPLPTFNTATSESLHAPPQELAQRLYTPYIEWLISVKEREVAKNYLNHISQQLRDSAPKDLQSLAYLLRLYSRSDNFQSLLTQLNRLSESTRANFLETYSHLLFPQPYQKLVYGSSNRFGVSPELIYSVIRQESAFNSEARSPMDAFGLMQLIPRVAELSAEKYGVDYKTPDDLYSAQVNIPLGSALLRKLWDRYRGNLVLSVAAYNASEKAIQGWLNSRFQGNTLEFIEDIPYSETQQYVKLVLRNFVAYQILNASRKNVFFPEWALRIDHVSTTPRSTASN